WSALRDDPGAVLLLLRLPAARLDHDGCSPSFVSLLDEPALPQQALARLSEPDCGFVNWNDADIRPVYQAALIYARIAEQLAIRTGLVDADVAWVGGLLAPLGWFAV